MHGARDHDGHEHTHATGPATVLAPASSRIVHLDCFSGIAGDMTLGALLHAGVPLEYVADKLATLPIEGYRIVTRRVARSGIAATKLDVEIDPSQPERTYAQIRVMIEQARELPHGARERAVRIFERLGLAEARVHQVPLEDVHFHEVGAVDAIVDVCGTALALDYLGARVTSTPLPQGRGFVRTSHGVLPIPPPAALEAALGLPVYGVDVEAELVTPTGASIVGALAEAFGPMPPMRIESIGWGSGTIDLPDRPNLLRVVVGEPLGQFAGAHVVIEANVDDMSPELSGFLIERMLESGALDAWLQPVMMKKARPGVIVSVLARGEDERALSTLLLSESTTIGVRSHAVDRRELPRHFEMVQTPYGAIPIKIASDGTASNVSPEFEACKAAARAHGVPLKEVFARAIAAYWSSR